VVAGVPVIVGGATAVTVIVNGAREADAVPSLTEIVMLANAPRLPDAGVPDNCPVVVLNKAQVGLFTIENVSAAPRGLDAAGMNEYVCPTVAEVEGVPVMVGGATAATVIVNGARDADDAPLLTEIVTLPNVPTLADVGVPDSWPVVVLNDAQDGMLEIEKVSVPPPGFDVVGVNE